MYPSQGVVVVRVAHWLYVTVGEEHLENDDNNNNIFFRHFDIVTFVQKSL